VSRVESSRAGTDDGQIRWKGTHPGKDAFSLLPRGNYASPRRSHYFYFFFSALLRDLQRQKTRVIALAAPLFSPKYGFVAHFEALHLTLVMPKYFNQVIVITTSRVQSRCAFIRQDFIFAILSRNRRESRRDLH